MDKAFLYIHIFTTRGNLTFAIARMSFAIAAMSLLDMSCACCAFAHSRGEQVLFAWWTCFLSYSGNCTVEKRKKNTFTGIKANALKWSTALQTLMSLFFFFFPRLYLNGVPETAEPRRFSVFRPFWGCTNILKAFKSIDGGSVSAFTCAARACDCTECQCLHVSEAETLDKADCPCLLCVCACVHVCLCVCVRAEWFPAPLAVLFSCKSWSIFCRRESGQMQQPLFPPFFPVC